MVVSLFLVVTTVYKLVTAIIHGSHSSESILQSFIHLLMPFAVADHFFFLGKVLSFTHGNDTMPVLSVVHVFAGGGATLQAGAKPLKVPGVVCGDDGFARDEAMDSLSGEKVGWQGGHSMGGSQSCHRVDTKHSWRQT